MKMYSYIYIQENRTPKESPKQQKSHHWISTTILTLYQSFVWRYNKGATDVRLQYALKMGKGLTWSLWTLTKDINTNKTYMKKHQSTKQYLLTDWTYLLTVMLSRYSYIRGWSIYSVNWCAVGEWNVTGNIL